jgi:hypothetical protein
VPSIRELAHSRPSPFRPITLAKTNSFPRREGRFTRFLRSPFRLLPLLACSKLTPHEFIRKWQAAQLKKRTLTNLYNERPTWLDLAHKKLDAAVFAAYGWDPAMSDDDLLAALLALNLERAANESAHAH